MKFDAVSVSYSGRSVLRDITLTIERGEFVFIVGPSGGGKTSLIRAMTAELSQSSGSIVDDNGTSLVLMSEKQLLAYRRSIGVIFQDFKLIATKTVRENVAFAMEACWYSDALIRQRVPEILGQVGILSRADSFPRMLSGGEQQRAAIARALIHNPQTLIADEPTGNLDPLNSREIFRMLSELHQQGKTVIVSTHDPSIVNAFRHRVIRLEHGSIVSDMSPGVYA